MTLGEFKKKLEDSGIDDTVTLVEFYNPEEGPESLIIYLRGGKEIVINLEEK